MQLSGCSWKLFGTWLCGQYMFRIISVYPESEKDALTQMPDWVTPVAASEFLTRMKKHVPDEKGWFTQFGHFDGQELTLILAGCLPHDRIQLTLKHEMAHAILWLLGLSDPASDVRECQTEMLAMHLNLDSIVYPKLD